MWRPVQMAIEVQIPREAVEPALAATAALCGEQRAVGNATADLVAALATCGFEAEVDFHSGDVWIEVFRGRYWEAQEQLFAALAPYARGRVDVLARDGARWGYHLHGGSLEREAVA
jgi:hypothetical protein